MPGTYIVRFTHYAPHADHEAAVGGALAGRVARREWAWRPRSNPGAALPTDFGVVALTAAAKVRKWGERERETVCVIRSIDGFLFTNPCSLLQAALLAAPFVRDIHPERKLTRSLAWVDAAQEAGDAPPPPPPPCNCSLCVGADGAVVKRPGR